MADSSAFVSAITESLGDVTLDQLVDLTQQDNPTSFSGSSDRTAIVNYFKGSNDLDAHSPYFGEKLLPGYGVGSLSNREFDMFPSINGNALFTGIAKIKESAYTQFKEAGLVETYTIDTQDCRSPDDHPVIPPNIPDVTKITFTESQLKASIYFLGDQPTPNTPITEGTLRPYLLSPPQFQVNDLPSIDGQIDNIKTLFADTFKKIIIDAVNTTYKSLSDADKTKKMEELLKYTFGRGTVITSNTAPWFNPTFTAQQSIDHHAALGLRRAKSMAFMMKNSMLAAARSLVSAQGLEGAYGRILQDYATNNVHPESDDRNQWGFIIKEGHATFDQKFGTSGVSRDNIIARVATLEIVLDTKTTASVALGGVK